MTSSPVDPGATPADVSRLDEQVCFDLYAASRAVTGLYRPLLEPLGLTYPQYLVLLVLAEHDQQGPRTVRQVVEALRLDYGTVSPLLKRLEATGVVERRRRTDDERSVAVGLTDEGRALARRAADVPAQVGQAMGLDPAGMAGLSETLRALTASVTSWSGALGTAG